MTDEQKKAKHDFAMHQDKLLWSRMQLLVAVQGGALVGVYSLPTKDFLIAVGLAVLGFLLTCLILLTMIRDDSLGSRAFEESGVPASVTGLPWWFKGRYFAYAAIGLLLLADVLLLVHVSPK